MPAVPRAGFAPLGGAWVMGHRPRYREVFPVRPGRILLGLFAGGLWMALTGVQATTVGAYCWTTLAAGIIAGAVAALLSRIGDRGCAVGVAGAAAVGISAATVVIIVNWAGGHWPLW